MASLSGRIEFAVPNGDGTFSGKLNRREVQFGPVVEQPMGRPDSMRQHHSQHHWWVTHEESRREVFIIAGDPQERGVEVNLSSPLATYNKDDFKFK